MAQLPGGAFIKGRDRIVRIVSNGGVRKSPATPAAGVNGTYATPTGLTMRPLKGLISAEFTPVVNTQEIFLLGSDGYRDAVGVSQAGDLACSAFFTRELTADGAVDTTALTLDEDLATIMNATHNLDNEIYVEVLTYLGQQGSNFMYDAKAFNAGVADLSETAPADGLIELSWTFQSRGEVYVGILDAGTSQLDVYGAD